MAKEVMIAVLSVQVRPRAYANRYIYISLEDIRSCRIGINERTEEKYYLMDLLFNIAARDNKELGDV